MPVSLNAEDTNQVLDRLFEINYQTGLPVDELAQAYLNLGKDLLDLELGIISQVEESQYRVFAVTENSIGIVPNQVFDLGDTLCQEVFEKNEIVFHGQLSKLQEKKNHPAVKNMHLESYVGVPLYMCGKLFGTLNFSSQRPRGPLSTLELIVVKTMAAHLGKKLSQEIDMSMYRMILRNIAHELRAPLNGIIGSEDILRESDLTHDQFEMLDLISRSSRSLEIAISEVSYATKLLYDTKAGECREPLALLNKAHITYERSLKEKGIHINLKISEFPPVKCSHDIFENAYRLILKDCISRESDRKEITVEGLFDQEYARIIITDNGPCLSGNVKHVLNSFGTIEGIQKGMKMSGVNLDLTLAAISMNLAGGYLRVYVAPDKSSTTFHLIFPVI